MARSDTGSIGDIFGVDNVVAVCDPVYQSMAPTLWRGRAGDHVEGKGWSKIVYMPCKEGNGFCQELPQQPVDMIYLCSQTIHRIG